MERGHRMARQPNGMGTDPVEPDPRNWEQVNNILAGILIITVIAGGAAYSVSRAIKPGCGATLSDREDQRQRMEDIEKTLAAVEAAGQQSGE